MKQFKLETNGKEFYILLSLNDEGKIVDAYGKESKIVDGYNEMKQSIYAIGNLEEILNFGSRYTYRLYRKVIIPEDAIIHQILTGERMRLYQVNKFIAEAVQKISDFAKSFNLIIGELKKYTTLSINNPILIRYFESSDFSKEQWFEICYHSLRINNLAYHNTDIDLKCLDSKQLYELLSVFFDGEEKELCEGIGPTFTLINRINEKQYFEICRRIIQRAIRVKDEYSDEISKKFLLSDIDEKKLTQLQYFEICELMIRLSHYNLGDVNDELITKDQFSQLEKIILNKYLTRSSK